MSLFSCEKSPATVEPKISISLIEARETSIDFTLTPVDAETVAWQIVETGTTVPGAEEIISSGHQVGTGTGTYTADNLTAGTSYTIAAAALNGEIYSSVAILETATSQSEPDEPAVPTLAIESVIPARKSIAFTYSSENAEAISPSRVMHCSAFSWSVVRQRPFSSRTSSGLLPEGCTGVLAARPCRHWTDGR